MSFIVYFLILAVAGSLIGALAYALFPGEGDSGGCDSGDGGGGGDGGGSC